jgi:hypothetical protein
MTAEDIRRIQSSLEDFGDQSHHFDVASGGANGERRDILEETEMPFIGVADFWEKQLDEPFEKYDYWRQQEKRSRREE